MKYYCECISVTLAEKLKEKGMPIRIDYDTERTDATYGFVFDWLMEKGRRVYIIRHSREDLWRSQLNDNPDFCPKYLKSWHEAANAAIEKALTLI